MKSLEWLFVHIEPPERDLFDNWNHAILYILQWAINSDVQPTHHDTQVVCSLILDIAQTITIPNVGLLIECFKLIENFLVWILVPKTIVYFVSDLFCSKESEIDCISNCLWWGRVFQEMTKTSLWNEHRPNLRFRFRFSMPINLTNNFYFDQILLDWSIE